MFRALTELLHSMNVKRPLLFEPLSIRDIRSKNRIMVSPMCQYRSVEGGPVDWHLVHLGQFAIGGAGIVFHEETAISRDGRKTWHCAGLYEAAHVEAYKRINQFIAQQGAVAAIQLGHAGRKGSNAGAMFDWRPLDASDAQHGMPPWQTLSSSDIANESHWPAPQPMTVAQINECIDDWVQATQMADAAEFDLLEIHGAHGYLIHQFLSPLANHRTDQYGGSLENRMRFALEITEAVRHAWPASKPLFFRMSCVDGLGGVWNLDDSVRLAIELKNIGVDVIDCSSGGISGNTDMKQLQRVPGYHLEFSNRIRREVGIETVAVGLITEAAQAESILVNGQADIVAMARELMAQPGWPLQAARQLSLEDPWATQPDDYAFRLRRRHEVAQLTLEQLGEDADPTLSRLVGSYESS